MPKYKLHKIQRQGKIIRAHIKPPEGSEPVTLVWNLKPGEKPEDRSKQINEAIERELAELNAKDEPLPEPVDITAKIRQSNKTEHKGK